MRGRGAKTGGYRPGAKRQQIQVTVQAPLIQRPRGQWRPRGAASGLQVVGSSFADFVPSRPRRSRPTNSGRFRGGPELLQIQTRPRGYVESAKTRGSKNVLNTSRPLPEWSKRHSLVSSAGAEKRCRTENQQLSGSPSRPKRGGVYKICCYQKPLFTACFRTPRLTPGASQPSA